MTWKAYAIVIDVASITRGAFHQTATSKNEYRLFMVPASTSLKADHLPLLSLNDLAVVNQDFGERRAEVSKFRTCQIEFAQRPSLIATFT